jgi:hypothetical protein
VGSDLDHEQPQDCDRERQDERLVERHPGAKPEQIEAARAELAKGTGLGKTTRLIGLGTGTVHRLKREMAAV